MFKNQEPQSYERDKTPEEQAIISAVLRYLPEFIEEHGGTPVAQMGEDVIHVLDQTKLTKQEQEELAADGVAGGYLFHQQQAMVVPDAHSRLKTAERIVHELMHFESFVSLEVPSSQLSPRDQHGTTLRVKETELFPRRIGLSIFDKTHAMRFFRDIDEAVIEELTIRFDRRYFPRIPVLQEEIVSRERFKTLVGEASEEVLSCITRQENDGTWTTTVHEYAYGELRQNLWSLIDQLHQRNPDLFTSREEIFTIFAKAVLTGRLMQLARLVENTFGEGSFRTLGQTTGIGARDHY